MARGLGWAATFGVPAAYAQEPRFFRVATGPTESTYFQIGSLVGQVISSPPGARDCDRGGSCGVPGLIGVAQTTAGSVANVDLIKNRRIDSALCQADIAYWAYYGSGMYRLSGGIDNLRAICNLFPEAIHIVARRDNRITSLEGLRGKRVSLGERDSGTRVTARAILDAAGVPETSFSPQFLPVGQSADALRENRLDAFFEISGAPSPVIADLASQHEVSLLPLDGALAQRLRAGAPFFSPAVLPAATYAGVGETATLSIGSLWVVQATVEEPLVHALVRALFNPANRRALDQHPMGQRIRLETALEGVALELHPGAALFYFEAGIDPGQVRRTIP